MGVGVGVLVGVAVGGADVAVAVGDGGVEALQPTRKNKIGMRGM